MIAATIQIDWIAISAIATLIMAFATFLTLWQSRKQLEEMKRQWSEEHQPVIDAKYVKSPPKNYGIQLINNGKGEADNIKISFDLSTIENVPMCVTERVGFIESQSYNLLPNRQIIISLIDIKNNIVNGVDISASEMIKVVKFLRKSFSIKVHFGKDYRFTEDYTLDGKSFSKPISTTIQEELNQIQNELSQTRELMIKYIIKK